MNNMDNNVKMEAKIANLSQIETLANERQAWRSWVSSAMAMNQKAYLMMVMM